METNAEKLRSMIYRFEQTGNISTDETAWLLNYTYGLLYENDNLRKGNGREEKTQQKPNI